MCSLAGIFVSCTYLTILCDMIVLGGCIFGIYMHECCIHMPKQNEDSVTCIFSVAERNQISRCVT